MVIQEVILVDKNDNEIGVMEKMDAHRQPNLHRAFSVFILNDKDEMLLQQRAWGKYHSAGLWTNACCSHPAPGEKTLNAANRRLNEELGFNTELKKVFDFTYQAVFSNGLIEYEFDHVFIGNYNGIINADKEEIVDYCFKSITAIKLEILSNPDIYTEWFKIALPKFETFMNTKEGVLI